MAILSNKRGFVYPLTPRGRASLLDLMTEPTHRIAGNHLIVGFEADPAVVREYVPEPLELDGSGLVYLRTFEGWVYTERNSTEFVSNERIEFCETFFWIPCYLNDERYHYLLYSWVNRDWLAYLGRHGGQPHKIADVQMTQFHPADTVYNSAHAGTRIAVSVNCVGQVLRAHCDLEQEVDMDDTSLPYHSEQPPPKYLGHRYFWGVCEDRPLVDDLVAHWGDNIDIDSVWTGPADVTFFDAENEEVLPFQPRQVIGGWFFTMRFDHSSSPPQVIHTYSH
jgi:hypothetical protein